MLPKSTPRCEVGVHRLDAFLQGGDGAAVATGRASGQAVGGRRAGAPPRGLHYGARDAPTTLAHLALAAACTGRRDRVQCVAGRLSEPLGVDSTAACMLLQEKCGHIVCCRHYLAGQSMPQHGSSPSSHLTAPIGQPLSLDTLAGLRTPKMALVRTATLVVGAPVALFVGTVR